mmetsp:Transcript_23612/g.47773  ORF Transcript_23612/g.47773 Transcript_23612/m.47773 type:complete len:105 (+) Transcript_23612:667-981(+)
MHGNKYHSCVYCWDNAQIATKSRGKWLLRSKFSDRSMDFFWDYIRLWPRSSGFRVCREYNTHRTRDNSFHWMRGFLDAHVRLVGNDQAGMIHKKKRSLGTALNN